MAPVSISGDTIPHSILGTYDGGKVFLRPARPGTGIIAGGGVRAVLEAAGVKNVLSKSLGSNNQLSVVTATLNGLSQLRTADQISNIRGEEVSGPAFTQVSKAEEQVVVEEPAEANS
jgi:small subunit ribosomal protein S5